MPKALVKNCVKPVEGMLRFCGLLAGFGTVVSFTTRVVVEKLGGFAGVFTGFIRGFSHSYEPGFPSVSGWVLPIIHKTYNKLQLVSLLFIVFNRRSLV